MIDAQHVLFRVNNFLNECQTDEEKAEAFDYLLFVFKHSSSQSLIYVHSQPIHQIL